MGWSYGQGETERERHGIGALDIEPNWEKKLIEAQEEMG